MILIMTPCPICKVWWWKVSFAATVHFSLPFSAYLLVQTVADFFGKGMQGFQKFIVDRYSLVDELCPGVLHLRDWEAASRGFRVEWS